MSAPKETSVGKVVGLGVFAFTGMLFGGLFGFPAYGRYQDVQNATNEVRVSSIQIQNQAQRVEIEKQKAEIRVQEAKGIAESQTIIASSLDSNYLQYLAIKAQEKMAEGSNHTEIYIPSGENGIPLVRAVNPHPPTDQPKDDKEKKK